MKGFLKDADAVRDKNESLHIVIADIRELAYRSEDVLETFIFEVASRRRRGRGGFGGYIIRRFACIFNECVTIHKAGSKIGTIKIKISNLTSRLQRYGIRDLSPRAEGEGSSSAHEKQLQLRRTYSHVVEGDFVGFQEDITKLVAALVDEDKRFRAISIRGMGGSGKTTLAKIIYHHERVRRHFDAFAWACISQQWTVEDGLQEILINLMPEKREVIAKMRHEDLVRQLFKIQEEKKCLVVLDDVWSTYVYDIIRSTFPNEKMGSKILLTTRNWDVARHIDPSGFLHETRQLDDKESWELFQKKAFLRGDDKGTVVADSTIDQKRELGREMVKGCSGLPLAIVVLGGLLVRKHTLDEWKAVHQRMDTYLRSYDKIEGMLMVLTLSYHGLPYWLKPCFLYLGNYPEDYEIETEELYQLWIAEGFISVEKEERGEEETMMEVAGRYLNELANRGMVLVQIEEDDYYSTSSSSRRFKSCRLHDLMREISLTIDREENLLKIVDFRHRNEPQHYSSSHSSKTHRLAVYLDGHLDASRNLFFDQEKSFRSVLFFFEGVWIDEFGEQMVPRLLKYLKLARVLHLQGFIFSSFMGRALPKEIGNLIHLRYLSLRNADFNELPSSIGNLKYLETLDLRVNCSLTVPNVLWKLERLRHLYFPYFGGDLVTKGKLRLKGLNNLETLETLYVDHCNVKDIRTLTNLRKLVIKSIRMTHLDLMEIASNLKRSVPQRLPLLRSSSVFIHDFKFCSEEDLTLLRQILLECHHLHKFYIQGVIHKLPEYQLGCSHSSSITHLILRGSELEEDPLARLEKYLPNLISLSLAYMSFVGNKMVCSAQGFPRLKYLLLADLPNFEEWEVHEGAMTSLSILKINNCTKLKMVPEGLRFVTGLQKLVIFDMPLQFIDRLRVVGGKEGEDFDKVHHVPSITFC